MSERHRDRSREMQVEDEPVKDTSKSKIIYMSGDLFDSVPENAVIVHSTNCIGVWGAGFALALKQRCPAAFKVYREHCSSATSLSDLAGSCLLIDPQSGDHERTGDIGRRWYIACLFTSLGYGRRSGRNPGRSNRQDILTFTDQALKDLQQALVDLEEGEGGDADEVAGDLYSPKINAGRFAVPWDETSRLIDLHFGQVERTWTVFG